MASAFFCHLHPLACTSSFHSPWRKGTRVPRRWRRGSPLDSASLLLLSPWGWNLPRGEGGGGDAVGETGAEVVVLGEEEDGAARRLRPRQWCLSRWKAMSETSPASSSSGCAGLRVAVFVFPPRLLGRWSVTRPNPSDCT